MLDNLTIVVVGLIVGLSILVVFDYIAKKRGWE